MAVIVSIHPALAEVPDPAKASDPERTAQVLADFERYAKKAMADWRTPGMAVAIVRGDDVIYEKAFGVKQLGKDDPVTTDTVFQIGSTSKAFTAALVAMLVDEGRLKWDDKVLSRLEDFRMYDPWVTKEFTITDLMAQRSGMPPHAADTLIMTGFGRDRVIDSLRYVKPAASFRASYAYQNNLWLVAAKLIEKITGETWEKNARNRIFRPLGMTASSTDKKSYTEGDDVAALHYDNDGTIIVLPMDWPHIGWTYAYGPAGGINSNIKDISKWMRMQASSGIFKGNRIIKEESARFMREPKTTIPEAEGRGPNQYYCLGWVHREARPYPITWHNGGTSGSKTMIAFVPEAKLGIAVLSNVVESSLPESLAWKFFDIYFGNPDRDWSKEALDAAKRSAQEAKAKEPKAPAVPAPPMALDRYAGDYSNEVYGTVNIAKRSDGLVFTIGPDRVEISLRPWDGNIFMGSWDYYAAKDDVGPVTFDVDSKGAVRNVTVDLINADGTGVFRRVTPAGVISATAPREESGSGAGRDKVVIEGMKVTREKAPSVSFDRIYTAAAAVNGVKTITYSELQGLRKTGEKFYLVDVLSADDYRTGHIPEAISFPVKTINPYNAVNKIPMGANVVVYCLDNHCPYSTEAAQKLAGYGYKVLAYKGGLDEWQQKGNALQR